MTVVGTVWVVRPSQAARITDRARSGVDPAGTDRRDSSWQRDPHAMAYGPESVPPGRAADPRPLHPADLDRPGGWGGAS